MKDVKILVLDVKTYQPCFECGALAVQYTETGDFEGKNVGITRLHRPECPLRVSLRVGGRPRDLLGEIPL